MRRAYPAATALPQDVLVGSWVGRLLGRWGVAAGSAGTDDHADPADRARAPARARYPDALRKPAVAGARRSAPAHVGDSLPVPTLDDGGGPWQPRWTRVPPVPATLPLVVAAPPRGALPARHTAPLSRRPVLEPFSGNGLPWTAVGRVDVPSGWGSGVLVGPRHVLTASHVVAWGQGRDRADLHAPGWLRFTPAARPGRAPFGRADAVAVHYALPVAPPVIEPYEERYDYAICVLDGRIGDDVGWLGVRGYRDEWDGEPLWTLIGYRGPTAAEAEPVAVGGLRLDGHGDQSDDSQVIFHAAAVGVGVSGGPVLAQWPGEPAPSVVAVQSWSNEHRSGACGGHRLVELVTTALSEHP